MDTEKDDGTNPLKKTLKLAKEQRKLWEPEQPGASNRIPTPPRPSNVSPVSFSLSPRSCSSADSESDHPVIDDTSCHPLRVKPGLVPIYLGKKRI